MKIMAPPKPEMSSALMSKDEAVEALGGAPEYANINGVVMWITDIPVDKAFAILKKKLKALGYKESYGVLRKDENHGKE